MATKESLEPALNNFAEVARRYCDWVEGEFRDPRQALREARLLLAELQLAAVRLPTTDSVGEEEAIALSPEEWSHFFRKFSDLPLNGYWDVSNPLEETKPTFHSLADDLAEIYQQVKAGLSLFDKSITLSLRGSGGSTFKSIGGGTSPARSALCMVGHHGWRPRRYASKWSSSALLLIPHPSNQAVEQG